MLRSASIQSLLLATSVFVAAPAIQAQSAPSSGAATSPVQLTVVPPSAGQRWQLQFTNTSSAAVDLAVDRALIRAEITPPTPVAVPGRRAPRRPKVFRCRSPIASQRTLEIARTSLAPNGSYQEAFDLLAVCGIRAADRLVPGASIQFYYGTATRRPNALRAVLFSADGNVGVINEIPAQQPMLVPEGASWVTPLAASVSATTAITTNVSGGAEAATADGARIRVTLAARGSSIETAYYRPGMISLEVVSAKGTRSVCSDAPRGYVGLRDYLRTFRGRPSAVASLNLGHICARNVLEEPGLYLARARFESTVPSSDGSRATFSGIAYSRWVWVRIVRGRSTARYEPLAPADPFATVARSDQ